MGERTRLPPKSCAEMDRATHVATREPLVHVGNDL